MGDSPAGEEASGWPIKRDFALINGLGDASRLVDLGVLELHRIDGANDFSHGMLHLLSHGFERLAKYSVFLAVLEREGAAPDASFMRCLGHDVEKSLSALLEVVEEREIYAGRQAAIDDIEFMRADPDLKRFLALFSRFGTSDRYYDLDVLIRPEIQGTPAEVADPAQEWREIENDFFHRIPGSLEAIAADPTALQWLMRQATREIAAVLDRFHRCLARMWFWGALGPKGPSSATSALSAINALNDDQLGEPRPLRR